MAGETLKWTFDNDHVTIDVKYDPKTESHHPKGEVVIRVESVDLWDPKDTPAIIAEMAQAVLEGVKAWNER